MMKISSVVKILGFSLLSFMSTELFADTGTAISDSVITAKIKSKMVMDPSISAFKVDVNTNTENIVIETNSGVVFLSGHVNTQKEAENAVSLAKTITLQGRVIKTGRFLILHEAVEKTLIDQLGLHYQFTHQIALRSEQAAVRADKITWKEYDRFMQIYIKEIGDKKLRKVPDNLDTRPYRAEHERALLIRLKHAQTQLPRV